MVAEHAGRLNPTKSGGHRRRFWFLNSTVNNWLLSSCFFGSGVVFAEGEEKDWNSLHSSVFLQRLAVFSTTLLSFLDSFQYSTSCFLNGENKGQSYIWSNYSWLLLRANKHCTQFAGHGDTYLVLHVFGPFLGRSPSKSICGNLSVSLLCLCSFTSCFPGWGISWTERKRSKKKSEIYVSHSLPLSTSTLLSLFTSSFSFA